MQPFRTATTPDALTLAYTAGLFDGEGSIVILCGHRRLVSGALSPRYSLQVSITNTNATLIAWLRATYGGHIADNSRYKSRGTRQTCGVWRIMSRSAGLFLRDIRPYLRVKAPQADIALEFSELMRRQGPSKHGYGLEAIAKHEANRQQLRQLTAGDCRRRPAGAAADA